MGENLWLLMIIYNRYASKCLCISKYWASSVIFNAKLLPCISGAKTWSFYSYQNSCLTFPVWTHAWLCQSDDAALKYKLSRLYEWFQLLIIWNLIFFWTHTFSVIYNVKLLTWQKSPGVGCLCWTFFGSAAVLEDLYSRRDDLNHQIKQEEDEKERLQHDFQVLSDKLRRVSESLSQRIAARAAFNRTISETEASYTKVCLCPLSHHFYYLGLVLGNMF